MDFAGVKEVLDVASYHPDAVAIATGTPADNLTLDLLIVRAADAVAKEDMAEAMASLKRAQGLGPVGYQAMQIAASHMFLAATRDDQLAFDAALQSWINARKLYPANADQRVIASRHLVALLARAPATLVDGARTAVPVPRLPQPSETFMAAVSANLEIWIKLAVAENAPWITVSNPAAYSYDEANEELREVYVAAALDDTQTALIITLSESLEYSSSQVFY